MIKLLAIGLFCTLATALMSCQNLVPEKGGDGSHTSALDDGPNGYNAVLKTYQAAETASDQITLDSFFKDEVDFTIDDLKSGATNCRDIIDTHDIRANVKPWPADLKSFLIDELRQFPALPLVSLSLHGLYLVDPSIMSSGQTGAAAGIACDRGSDWKGLVFLNYNSFVRDRGKGLGKWNNLRIASNKHIIHEAGDNAAATLIHEIIHTIDNKLFIHGQPELQRIRSQIFQMAWNGFTSPRAKPISIFFLTGSQNSEFDIKTAMTSELSRCRGSSALNADTEVSARDDQSIPEKSTAPQTLAKDLKYLAEETNFIVPYALASAAEDFAESLTVYHFGLNRKSWQLRTVYDRPITSSSTNNAEVLYTHDTSEVLENNSAQRDKICAMAQLLFGSCQL